MATHRDHTQGSTNPPPPVSAFQRWGGDGWQIHPSVAEEMKAPGLTAAGFAAELGCFLAELGDVLAQVLPVTPTLAAAFWLRL